ncbi:hypothetical protein BJ170DRAFT_677720 [Xylariales sp. AK1849]|nr:hypothetical protein BJ170DRAFT_677720 [Xylariales sp. AK1849]
MSIRITDCFYLFKSWHHYNRCCAGWKIWEGTDCQGVVAIVSGALLLILEGVYRYKRRGNTGAIAGDAGSAARRALGMDIVGKMESALRARGVQFESISVPALAARNADGVSSTTISMLGVRDLETGAATDHLLALRDDGTGTMTVRNTPQDKLSRRHDGPGLKVNCSSSLTGLGSRTTTPPNMADLTCRCLNTLVLMNLGDGKEVGFRIIPESNGFGEEYEDVLVCGKVD